MLFSNKAKKVLDIEQIEKNYADDDPLQLEKGDFLAILIAMFSVVGPILLGFLGLMVFLAWLFGVFR